MATRRQKKANRRNAKRSTGPRTPEGKARSSQNACKHGLFARDTVLPDENPEEFLDLIATLEQELNAIGGFERRLVRHIADAEWRIRRTAQDRSPWVERSGTLGANTPQRQPRKGYRSVYTPTLVSLRFSGMVAASPSGSAKDERRLRPANRSRKPQTDECWY